MGLPSSGSLTLQQIQSEFGGSNPINMSEYYRGGAYVTQNNTSVPTSGQISMSQFYGAQRAAEVVGDAAWFQIGKNGSTVVNLSAMGDSYKTLIMVDHANHSNAYPLSDIGQPTTSLGNPALDRVAYTTNLNQITVVQVYRVWCGTNPSITINRGGNAFPGNIALTGYIVRSQLGTYFGNSVTYPGAQQLTFSISAGGITFLGTTSRFSGISAPTNLNYAYPGISGQGVSGFRKTTTAGSMTHSWSTTDLNWSAAGMHYQVL